MADSKITALTALGAAPATEDLLPVVDVSDTTQSAGGTTKSMTVDNLFTSPTFTTSITTPITYGSSAANGDHIIEGTSNATKTTSYVQVQPTVGDIVFGPNTNAGKGKLVVQDVGTGYVAIGDLDTQPDYGGIAISTALTSANYTLAQGITDSNLYINRPAGKSIIFRLGAASTDMTLSSAGDLTLPTPGTSSTSVVTIGATQTLTGKTLTSPIVSSGSRLSFGTTIEEKIRLYDTGTASTSYGIGTIASCTQIFSGATGDVAIYRGGTAGTQMARWSGATDALSLTGKISTYNSIATAGWGTVAIQAAGRSTAQSAAVASVSTYTVGAADGTFEVSANVRVTTATSHAFTVTCAYTDEGNTARTITMTFGLVAGGVTTTSIANANGTVPYHGVPLHIRCKAATAITIATTGTFTTVTYNVEGIIKQVA